MLKCTACGAPGAGVRSKLCLRCTQADWRKRHPDYMQQRARTWRAQNIEIVRLYKRNQRKSAKSVPRPDRLTILALAFNTDPDELIGFIIYRRKDFHLDPLRPAARTVATHGTPTDRDQHGSTQKLSR